MLLSTLRTGSVAAVDAGALDKVDLKLGLSSASKSGDSSLLWLQCPKLEEYRTEATKAGFLVSFIAALLGFTRFCKP